VPQMEGVSFGLVIVGGLWLGLWRGRGRLLGFVPVLLGTLVLWSTPLPDLLISGDGRHVGIVGEDDRLLVLRESKSDFTRDNLMELSGVAGEPLPLERWPGAECSADFCVITLNRGGRDWHVLMSRGRNFIEERALSAACERADIVIADRFLPRSCKPRWLLVDGRSLAESGGLSINLTEQRVRSVAEGQGEHGWWRPGV